MARNSQTPDPELVDKEVKVLELRRAGLTWDRIAQETGYENHSGAYKAYKRAITRTQQQPADELREQEIDRLDRMQLALWQKAMKGDERSIITIVRMIEQRAKLLGLYAPTKIEQDITTWDGDESIDRAVKDLAALLTANNEVRAIEGAMGNDTSESEPTTAK